MTPEELDRTIEFIIQSQARLAAAQEQDRIDRLHSEREVKAFDQRLAGLLEMQVQLLESQSQHFDQAEKRHQEALAEIREESQQFRREFRELMQESHVWQERFLTDAQKKHAETVEWLKRILEKLTDRLN
jgi:hypothetical protein